MKSSYSYTILGFYFAFGLCALTASCDLFNGRSFSETFSFDINPQSEISFETIDRQVALDSSITVYHFTIEPGDEITFKYQRNLIPPDNVTDAGLVETLVFQIPANTDSFEYRDNRLLEANTFYRRGCFCPESGAGFKIEDGFIRGEMLSANIWFIEASVTAETYNQTVEVPFDGVFRVRQ